MAQRQYKHSFKRQIKNTVSFISELLQKTPRKMTTVNDGLHILSEQIRQMAAQLQLNENKREELENRVETMNVSERANIIQISQEGGGCDETDIEPNISSGDQIQLESYKTIPEFSGKQHEYRSWRNQVYRRMKIISNFNQAKRENLTTILQRDQLRTKRNNFNGCNVL